MRSFVLRKIKYLIKLEMTFATAAASLALQ